MKHLFFSLFAFAFLTSIFSFQPKNAKWRNLFDGKTTKGWRGVYLDHFPDTGWVIKDRQLIHKSSAGKESVSGGDIVTDEEFTNFELELDFNVAQGGNSGIKYFVIERQPKPAGSAIGCEFQILDDENHPDAKLGVNGNRKAGSLYDLIPAPKDKLFLGPGKWNKARILVNGKHVEHWLNGKKTLEYDKGSEEFKARIAESKYQKFPFFGNDNKGHILLQDHGDEVAFKNIRIRTW